MAKIRELTDIHLREVSLVDKAANNKAFLFFKARGEGQGVGNSTQADGGAKYCVCSECGYSEKHKKLGEGKSVPCTKTKCPDCGTFMEGSDTKVLKKKKKINIVIDSDGTIGGTKISVNKEELKNLKDFSFSVRGGLDDTNPVSCSYSKFVETDDGFSRSETFYLSKGVNIMKTEISEQLKEYFGKDAEVDFEKAEDAEAIVKALEKVNEYRGDFPDDLKKAVAVIAKQAGFCDTLIAKITKKSKGGDEEEEEEEEDVVKAGAKFSKENLAKIKALVATVKALEDMISEEEGNTGKSVKKDEIGKAIEVITKSIESLEKNKEDKNKDNISKVLTKLTERLEAVEKGTGVKKSEDGQEGNEEDGDGTKWPSFSNRSD